VVATLLAFLGSLIPAALKAWLSSRKSPLQKEAEDDGAARQNAANEQAAAATEAKVAQAEADAPSTKADLVKELNDGTF
jgi:hypothetical protein